MPPCKKNLQRSKTPPAFSIKHGQALACLASGNVLSCPTEAVWGLSCHPFNIHAVARLLALKQRSVEKGLIVVFADFTQLEPLLANSVTVDQRQCLQKPTDTAITWLVSIKPGCMPAFIMGRHTKLAVRITQHSMMKRLCTDFGPLVSTSANPSGAQAATELFQVRRYFGDSVHYCQGHVGNADKPSTIKDLTTQKILRD